MYKGTYRQNIYDLNEFYRKQIKVDCLEFSNWTFNQLNIEQFNLFKLMNNFANWKKLKWIFIKLKKSSIL